MVLLEVLFSYSGLTTTPRLNRQAMESWATA